MDLEALFEEFFMYLRMKDYSDATISSYRTDFKILLEYLDTMKTPHTLENFVAKKIRQFAIFLKMKEYSPSTIARKINCLRSFAKFCINEEYLQDSPMKKVEVPKKEKQIPLYLTNEESERLLAAPTNILEKVVIYLFSYTGIRRQELINLELRDYDRDNNLLTVRKGKGKKDRIIPVNTRLKEVLEEYLRCRPDVTHGALIVGKYKGKISHSSLNFIFHKNLEKACITKPNMTIHKLRHTFATRLLNNNVDLVTIQELLGHADLTTTQVYAHTNMNNLKKAVDILN